MTPNSELEEIKARYAIHMAEEAQRELKKAAPQIERFTEIAASKGVAVYLRSAFKSVGDGRFVLCPFVSI